MAQRVDFSANASIYDRRNGTVLALNVAHELADSSGLQPGGRVLDVGAGTGRVAVVFAGIGYKIVALDPAVSMLNELRRKAPETRIEAVVGEGARLPFTGEHFEAVILARCV